MAAICSALAAGEGGGRKPARYRPATAINKLIGPPQMQTLCARIPICDPPYVRDFGWFVVGTNPVIRSTPAAPMLAPPDRMQLLAVRAGPINRQLRDDLVNRRD